jgi:ELWxxDGT repeat protein
MHLRRILPALSLALAVTTVATAQPAYRVADLVPSQGSGGLGSCAAERRTFVKAGAATFFPASDLVHGCELWVTDGTPAGTRMVKDVQAGPWGSDPAELTAVGSTLYFLARDGIHGGPELWKSDGTTAGTAMVRELDFYQNAIGFLTVANGVLHFVGPDLSNYAFKSQVWRSDGTSAGTVPVAGTSFSSVWNLVGTPTGFYFAAAPGPFSSMLYWSNDSSVTSLASFVSLPYFPRPVALGSSLFFPASDGASGLELWTSNGTAAGTKLTRDIAAGSASSSPGSTTGLAVLGGAVLFDGSGALWRSDGTTAGTLALSGPLALSRVVPFGGAAYFAADDGVHGNELWRSDGTAGGTGMVKDIVDGPLSALFGDAVLGGAAGGPLLFAASQQLWRSDGTDAGTTQVTSQPGGLAAGAPAVALGSGVLFAANGGTGLEPWISDGTSAGSSVLAEIGPDDGSSAPSWLADVLSTLYFSALDASGTAKLWKTDGTAAGTAAITGPVASAFAGPSRTTNVAGQPWLTAPGAALTQPLLRVSGTSVTTIKSFSADASLPTSLSASPARLSGCATCLGSVAYFAAYSDPRTRSLWRTDGTTDGTLDQGVITDPDGLTWSGAGGSVLFLAGTGASGNELYKVETGGPPTLVKDIRASGSSSPHGLVDAAGLLYFAADDGSGAELWKSDGTSAGTVQVKDIAAGAPSGLAAWDVLKHPSAVVGSTIFFAADDGSSGVELWKSDGTLAGTTQVKDIRPGAGGSNPSWLTTLRGTVYFVADDGATGPELWKTDGSAAGTVQVADILPGSAGSAPAELVAVTGSLMVFSADDGLHGRELWRSDGSAAGTLLVDDVNPGLPSADPAWLTPSGPRLYFAATESSGGRELWAVALEDTTGQSATVGFGTSTASVPETGGSVSLPLVVTTSDGQPLRFPVTTEFLVNGGTATQGLDYLLPPSPLTIPGGTASGSSVPLAVTIIDDNQNEGDETVVLRLVNPLGVTLAAPTSATVTIVDDDSASTISMADGSLGEGDSGLQTGLLSATLSNPSGQTITVEYTLVAGTATVGVDYQDSSGTLTFTPGQTVSSFAVQVVGDTLDEPDETFTVHLSHPVGASIARADGIATILDDDLPPALSINDVAVAEGNTGSAPATFTVALSAASAKTITVSWATASTTATAGLDYTTASGSLTFAAGVVSQTLAVPVLGDTLDEDDETFLVNLSAPVNATLADGQGVGTITDDDPLPALAVGDVTIAEGNSGTTNATFTVTLNPVSGRQVAVAYAAANGTAIAPGDYTASSGTLTFPAGSTTRTFSVPVVGDVLDEDDETFLVTLTSPVNATLADDQGVGTITDDDPLPALAVGDVTVAEGNSGTTNATFTVTLAPVSGRQVTVAYATANGTATAPGDYTATSGTLTFPAGTTTRTISVPVVGDTLDEPDEAFLVNLSAPVNGTLGDGQGAGTITDDDLPPALSIGDLSVTEGDTGSAPASLAITLSAASGFTITVPFSTADGTATAGTDYTAATGTLTFAPGTTSQNVSVPVLGDTLDELNETVLVNLGTPLNATIADGQGVLTINDNDPTPGLTVADLAFTEGNSGGTTNASVTVTLSAASGLQVSVGYATANGTATAPADFTAVSGTLTFAPGTTTKTITVPVVGDLLDEADETFLVNLSAPVNAVLADGSATVTITDDDPLPALSIAGTAAAERDAAGASVTLTVSLGAASGRSVTVAWATAPGTATAPSDYTTASGSLTFAPGQTSKTVSVALTGDLVPEPTETFAVTLSAPTNATLGSGTATVTIRDDDPVAADFGGDGKSDVVVYRAGAWLPFDFQTGNPLSGAFTGQPQAGCIPAPADFDGNGALEFSQLCGDKWYFYGPTGTLTKTITTGGTGSDYPVPADYDGDGKDDVVLFRAGAWLFYSYSTGLQTGGIFTGNPPPITGTRSIPYPADFDGDGKADFSIYSGGPWHFFNADGSYKKGIWTGSIAGDIPVAGDYDGDGVDDVVVWRAGSWLWFDYGTGLYDGAKSVFTGAPPHFTGGVPTPSPLDVDGDGKLDRTVYSGGPWHFFNPDGTYQKGIWCGAVAGDLPISRRPLP